MGIFCRIHVWIIFTISHPTISKYYIANYLKVKKNYKRRVLIDVGANGFFASPKYLLDSYSIYAPFTHAIMIEPEPHLYNAVVEPNSL